MSGITRRTVLGTGLASISSIVGLSAPALAQRKPKDLFRRIPTQYIAALADPGAKSGATATDWGWWYSDPGPTGVWLNQYDDLLRAGRISRNGWRFNPRDWWVDENGLLMENPVFNIQPGRFVVTGNREAISILTVHPKDDAGAMRWELSHDVTIEQVTHLECRAARYRPISDTEFCTPADVDQSVFKIKPGQPMPAPRGCHKKDYTVLFVIGVAVQGA